MIHDMAFISIGLGIGFVIGFFINDMWNQRFINKLFTVNAQMLKTIEYQFELSEEIKKND